ncbi:HlyD family efflux transporter periplasmic adaptor subunit [Caballeronia sp. LZ035]|uniref:HlyD family efflux transporter periplasmic adaptor subunit n=1 Tax=Caballeronia sp. LZ035 TaxID=3038568 RepID=UPI0028558463|nr:HlyD family efflux transporter periplasmic adaptor subunit [Caballeronia sp. LZ035]MDR5760769.1 HlyD family efflux transporter periplasmic adaptor subunit [Caballeronia sp. LZ035]
MNSPASPAPAGPPVKAARRTWLLMLILAVAVLAGIGWGVYYLLVARYHVETDDAYVDGNIVQITPQTSGTVIAVNADDTQLVSVGDTVVQIDPADARIALAQAEASLGQTVRRTRGLYVDDDLYRAQIEQRRSDLARAQADLRRRLATGTSGAVSQEDVSHARDAVASAQAALDASRQQLNANLALTANTTIADHPDVLSSATRVRDAWLGYARTTLPAPVTGYVAQRSVQVGQRVSPGMPLMSLVPLDQVWVDANFKEGQLRHIRIGQAVALTADVYGDSVVYHGKVVGVTPGTGSALALLPAQNATGNWIKIVQRLAVRVGIPAEELRKHPLRVGLSMNVDVDVKNTSGAQVSTMPVLAAVGAADRTDVFARDGDEAEASIARIVAHNK